MIRLLARLFGKRRSTVPLPEVVDLVELGLRAARQPVMVWLPLNVGGDGERRRWS